MGLIPRDDHVWRTVVKYANKRIENHRTDLERESVEWEDVIRIRAAIQELRALLGLPQELEDGTADLE